MPQVIIYLWFGITGGINNCKQEWWQFMLLLLTNGFVCTFYEDGPHQISFAVYVFIGHLNCFDNLVEFIRFITELRVFSHLKFVQDDFEVILISCLTVLFVFNREIIELIVNLDMVEKTLNIAIKQFINIFLIFVYCE